MSENLVCEPANNIRFFAFRLIVNEIFEEDNNEGNGQ